jgi:hypothetical protein
LDYDVRTNKQTTDPATMKLTEIDLPNPGPSTPLGHHSDGRIWYSDYARGTSACSNPKAKGQRMEDAK